MDDTLHRNAILIDGLVVSRWSPEIFRNMHKGGLTAANCTVCVWDGFRETMMNIAKMRRAMDDHADILMPIHSTACIRRAKDQGKVGLILGFQNAAGIEDRLEYLQLFKALGVGVIQLTYNTQNLVGAGCWEKNDSGLTGFGHEVVEEMNRLGMLVDLSHVGVRTADDAVRHSRKGCAYSHICPAGLFDHPRNKTDEALRLIVERGGFVGVATYPPFMRTGAATTLEDCVEVFEYVINLCGEANVGIGTDFTEGHGTEFFEYLWHDKGYARRLVPPRTTPPLVKGFESLADYPKLTHAMQKRGWTESRIRGVLGENWLRFLGEVWGG